MSGWVKIDTDWPFHEKVARAGLDCAGLHVASICWSRAQLTDGFVPPDVIWQLGRGADDLVGRMVECGLWHEPGCETQCCPYSDTHYVIHDFGHYQVLRDRAVKTSKDAARAAQARWNALRSANQDAERNAERNASRNAEGVRKKEEGYPREFEDAWSSYPRKIAKKKALREWRARVNAGWDTSDLERAARHYTALVKRERREARHVMHGSTFWGSDEPFADYVEAPPDEAPAMPTDPASGKRVSVDG